MSDTKVQSKRENERVMLFTNSIELSPTGGREMLCKLNCDILQDLFGPRLSQCQVPKTKLRGARSILSAFRGHLDGLNDSIIDNALHTLAEKDINKLFIDGSGFGEFARLVKRKFPQIEITTFFHNVEARFFLGALRNSKTIRASAVLVANYLAERKAVNHSDNLIALSERDSRLLETLYGRRATHVSAIALQDKAASDFGHKQEDSNEKFALFVGGGFYANQAGLNWYAKHVAPRVDLRTYVVGRGFDELKTQLSQSEKLAFVGATDSIGDWYRNAQFVVAPIFDGSGMKTKVAEALMFGKRIVGTVEAFSGYGDVAEQAGWLCLNADEFVAAIGAAQNTIVDSFDPKLRRIYEESYSYTAARARLADILGATGDQCGRKKGLSI